MQWRKVMKLLQERLELSVVVAMLTLCYHEQGKRMLVPLYKTARRY